MSRYGRVDIRLILLSSFCGIPSEKYQHFNTSKYPNIQTLLNVALFYLILYESRLFCEALVYGHLKRCPSFSICSSQVLHLLPPQSSKCYKSNCAMDLVARDADYKTAEHSIYRYIPSEATAITVCVLFSLATAFHLWKLLRTRTWFFIPFVFGGICTSTPVLGISSLCGS